MVGWLVLSCVNVNVNVNNCAVVCVTRCDARPLLLIPCNLVCCSRLLDLLAAS